MIPTWIDLQIHGDERGSLVAIETGRQVPFTVRRVYYIFGTKPGVTRGLHAHRRLHQLCIPVAGSCRMTLDNGRNRTDVLLSDPHLGLAIGPSIWREMHDFSPDCVLLVLADQEYDEADYIRNYQEFLTHAHSSFR